MRLLILSCRVLLNGFTVLSLLACALLTVIGIDSHRNSYMVVRYAANPNPRVWDSHTVSLQVTDYRVAFQSYRATFDHPKTVASYRKSLLQENGPRGVQWSRRARTSGGWLQAESSGFGHVGAPVSNLWPGGKVVGRWDRYSASLGLLVLILAILPILQLSRVARRWYRHRYHVGRCRACDYDLRATPDRCPECGRIAEPSRNATASTGAVDEQWNSIRSAGSPADRI